MACPLQGVTVLVRGMSGGTVSDADGNFSIIANDSLNDVLRYILCRIYYTEHQGSQL